MIRDTARTGPLRRPVPSLSGILAAGALTVAAVPAAAQMAPAEVAAATAAPRYAFAPVEGGALKLDRETGRVSLCAKRDTGFTCEAVPDSRDAYEAEIARLQRENEALRAAVAKISPPGPVPPAPLPPPGVAPEPDMSELDRALDYAERFYRRLKGFIDDLRSSNQGERL